MQKICNGGIRLTTLSGEQEVYFDMAMNMVEEVVRNNRAGKSTVMIVPVGPTDQYPIFARIVNAMDISLKNVWFFNMDEYLITPEKRIDDDHFMSFHHRMKTELYDRLSPDLTIPENQRFFPEPGQEAEYDRRMEQLGGVDLCLGGLGINGHIAFNEAPEADDPITPDEFAALPTRVLPITRETRTVNAIGYQRGDIHGMPEYCITVGMKQILASRRIYIALNREWQHGIARRALLGPQDAHVPASLLQRHGNVDFVATESIARGIV